MTDSGAYQILKYGGVDVSNKEIVKYQCDIGSDIGVILDIPTQYNVSREEALESAEMTFQRAIEVRDIIEQCSSTLWTLPIQGGAYIDILKTYAKKSAEIFGYGYSIYALGSPTTLLENYMLDKVIEMIFTVKTSTESSRPLHLFGAGHPLLLPFAIAMGVDLMDSASYILYARDRRYMTRRGTYKLSELDYLPCSCPVCSKYSVEELMEMADEELQKLLALHNLYTLYLELNEVKESIREGRLWEYLEEKSRAHPAARRAFEVIKRFLEFIYSKSPYEKPRGRGVFIISEDSVYNPKIMIPRRKILSDIMPEKKCLVLLPLLRSYEVEDEKLLKESILNKAKGYYHIDVKLCEVYVYHPILGLVPYHLVNVYPFSQFETYAYYSYQSIKTLIYTLIEYTMKILKLRKCSTIILMIYSRSRWQHMFEKLVKDYIDYIRNKGINLEIVKIDQIIEPVKCD